MMKRWNPGLAAAVFTAVIAITGCGTGQPTANTSSPSTQNETAPTQAVAPKQGVAKMLTTLNGLDTSVQQNHASAAATAGSQLEAAWSSFEDQVHSKFPSDYENVETSLDPLVAGTHTTPLDAGSLTTLSSQLRAALNQLATKLK